MYTLFTMFGFFVVLFELSIVGILSYNCGLNLDNVSQTFAIY